jgi:gas vesicle protein GvpL/GvpF
VSATGTYVYCIVAARKPPAVPRGASGPPGTGRPRLLPIKAGRYLAVSDAPLDQFGDQQAEVLLSDLRWVSRAAVAHEAVITSLLARSDAIVPMKLFTIFAGDDRALAQIASDWTRIERVLRRVTNQVEWGVRLSVDERRQKRSSRTEPVETGLDYLRAKQRIQAAAASRSHSHRQRVIKTLRALAAAATDTRRREIAPDSDNGHRLLLDAAFLVPRQRSGLFRTAVKRQSRELARSGYRVQLTGPWPPYSFVEPQK